MMSGKWIWTVVYSAVLTSSCSDPEPSVDVHNWKLISTGKGTYVLEATGRYKNAKSGVFNKHLETVDARGCHSINYVEDQFVKTLPGEVASFVIRMPVHSKAKVATARFFIDFWSVKQAVDEPGNLIFSEEKVVDASIHPPSLPEKPCSSRKEELRERARHDPQGADAEAIESMSREEVIATAINSAGYLCARVTDMYPQGSNIIAHCVEYRNGRGRAKYIIDTASMTVTPT
jgi:hypothetical protein